MRDGADNVVIVCSIENVDPMGVHTGDSVTVAPQQTLTDRQYQLLRDQAIAVIRAVGVETGGSNVQFAVNPATDEVVVIEMNPRVSRSSALASKATGFPIAKIAARLAVGYRLDEIDNDITKRTPASFEPMLDYVVVKWPRFAFEKFPGVETHLSTHMKSVGEVMAIGRTFRQAFAKAMRSRELDAPLDLSGDLLERIETPSADRFDLILELLGRGESEEEIRARTGIDLWFLRQLKRPRRRRSRASARTAPSTPAPPSSRPRRRTSTRPGSARRCARDRARRPAERDDPRLRPEPDRPGDRVRLLLRARGDDRARVRPRRGDGQLQPGDGVDRLRHVRPPVLRAADARGRAGDRRGRAAGGRDRPVRRADAAQARRRAGGRRRDAARHPAGGDRPGRGPRALRRAAASGSG